MNKQSFNLILMLSTALKKTVTLHYRKQDEFILRRRLHHPRPQPVVTFREKAGSFLKVRNC
jgi:hypothetical protein